MDLTSQVLYNIALYRIRLYFRHQTHPQLRVVFALAPSLHSIWSYFSIDLQKHIGHLLTWGVPLSISYHFAFSCCSWGSQGKNTEWFAIPFSSGPCLSELSTMTCPSRVALHDLAHSFTELDKTVFHVICLVSFL